MSRALVIKVDIDSSGAVTGARAVGHAAEQAGGEIRTSFNRANEGVRNIEGSLHTARTALVAFLSVDLAKEGLRGLVRAQVELQQIHYTLLSATGSALKANRAFQFVDRTSEELGLNLKESALGFAQMSAAAEANGVAMNTQEALFEAFAKASTTLHLSAAQSTSALMALQQMFSKGTIQAQELRLQLGQAIPGVTPRFIHAVLEMQKGTANAGKSFDQLLQSGELLTRKYVPQLTQALLDSADGWEEAATGLNANLNRVHNDWFKLKVAFSRGLGTSTSIAGIRAVGAAMESLTKHADAVVTAATAVGVVMAARYTGKGLAFIGAYVAKQATAVQMTLAHAAALRQDAAVTVVATQARSAEMAKTLEAVTAVRADTTATLAMVDATILAEQRHLAAARAAGVQSFALRELAVAERALAAAQVRRTGLVTQLASLGRQQAGVQSALAGAAAAQVAAQTRLASSAGVAARAMRGLKAVSTGLLSLVGGWPTLLFAAGAAVVYLAMRQTEAEKVTQSLTETTESLAEAQGKVTQSALEEARAQAAKGREAVEAARKELLAAQALETMHGGHRAIDELATRHAAEAYRGLTTALAGLEDQAQKSLVAKAFADTNAAVAAAAKQATDDFDGLRKSLVKQAAAMRKQIATLGEGTVGQLEYARAQAIANVAGHESGNIAKARIGTIKALYATLLDLARQLDAKKAADEAQKDASERAREEDAARKKALKELTDAVAAYNKKTLDMVDANEVARAKLDGVKQAQIDYRDAVLEATRAYNDLVRSGVDADQAADARQRRLDAAHDAYVLAAHSADQLASSTGALGQAQEDNIPRANAYYQTISQGSKSIADAMTSVLTDSVRSVSDLWGKLVDVAKQTVAQIISTWLQLRVVQPMLGSIFSGYGNSNAGGGSALSAVGQVFGLGKGGAGSGGQGSQGGLGGYASMAGSAYKAYGTVAGWLGGGSAAAAGGSALTGSSLLGGASGLYTGASVPASYTLGGAGTGAASGVSWVPIIGWIIAAVMANISLFDAGWNAGSDINKDLYKDELKTGDLAAISILTADKSLRDMGVSDKWASILSGSSIATWSWGYRDPKAERGGIDVDFGAAGVSGNSYTDWRAKKGWLNFGHDKRGTATSALSDDVMDSLDKMWDGINKSMSSAAQAMGVSMDDAFSIGLKTVTEKGEDSPSKFLVTYLGKTWTEATQEAAQQRIGADALLHVLQQSVGAVATQMAEQWQDDAAALADGVQTMAAIQASLTQGTSLLAVGADGTLTSVMQLVEGMQTAGQTLSQTYAGIIQANAAYLQFVAAFDPSSNGVGLGAVLSRINAAMQTDLDKANALAKAAGLQGAREQDLANIHQQAAQQAADAMAKMGNAAQGLASKLYGVTGVTLDAINQQIDALKSKVQDALGLALGDKSVYTDKAKLQLALKGLQSGAVSGDAVLGIAQRLYGGASQAYRDVFAQVLQVSGNTTAGLGSSLDKLSGLTTQRDQMQAAATAAQRVSDAQSLAGYVANLSSARGDTAAEVAQSLGFTLASLGKDLGVTDIQQYMQDLEQQDIPGSLGQASTVIVSAIQGIGHDIVQAITGGNVARPAQDFGTQIRKEPEPELVAPIDHDTGKDILDQLTGIRDELRRRRMDRDIRGGPLYSPGLGGPSMRV